MSVNNTNAKNNKLCVHIFNIVYMWTNYEFRISTYTRIGRSDRFDLVGIPCYFIKNVKLYLKNKIKETKCFLLVPEVMIRVRFWFSIIVISVVNIYVIRIIRHLHQLRTALGVLFCSAIITFNKRV